MNNPLSNFYRGKKILITGHTGFKGAWLSYWLHLMGADVYGYALSPEDNALFNRLELKDVIHSHIDDIRNNEKLLKYVQDIHPEIVFHLAAQALVRKSYGDPLLTFSTNVMGSVNLLESIKACDSVNSLVYITSDKCYWNNEWRWGYRENDPLGGADPYSASKASAEHAFKSYYLSYFQDRKNFGCGSTRAGNVIGGGDYSENRIVPDIIRSIEHNENITLRQPNATRPWQHVLDPLHGYLVLGKRLYENPTSHNGEAWNFGPSNQSIKTVEELTRSLIKIWGNATNTTLDIDKTQNQFYESTLLHLNIDKAQSLLNWNPTYHFDEAIQATGEWYLGIMRGENPINITRQQIINFSNKVYKSDD